MQQMKCKKESIMSEFDWTHFGEGYVGTVPVLENDRKQQDDISHGTVQGLFNEMKKSMGFYNAF